MRDRGVVNREFRKSKIDIAADLCEGKGVVRKCRKELKVEDEDILRILCRCRSSLSQSIHAIGVASIKVYPIPTLCWKVLDRDTRESIKWIFERSRGVQLGIYVHIEFRES
jgi:hypothetical protein